MSVDLLSTHGCDAGLDSIWELLVLGQCSAQTCASCSCSPCSGMCDPLKSSGPLQAHNVGLSQVRCCCPVDGSYLRSQGGERLKSVSKTLPLSCRSQGTWKGVCSSVIPVSVPGPGLLSLDPADWTWALKDFSFLPYRRYTIL